MIIPFFKPNLGILELNAVIEAISSGWLSTGPQTEIFEESFSNFLSKGDASLCNAVASATAGLHLALVALQADRETSIFIPTMTFTATAEVTEYVGAKLELIDSEQADPNVDLELLVSKVNNCKSKNVILMPVHFGGVPVDLEYLRENIKRKYFIVEDAAHAFTSEYDNRFVGMSDSDFIVFSFYANKTITTGEGGMVISNSKEMADKVRKLKSHGIDRMAFGRFQSNSIRAWDYDVIAAGFKYNLSDILASIGNVQITRALNMRFEREIIAKKYETALSKIEGIEFRKLPKSVKSSHHLFTISISEKTSKSRDFVSDELNKAGIGTSVHYKPIHEMTYWKDKYKFRSLDFPNSTKHYSKTLSLPIFPGMTSSEQDFVIENLMRILDKY